MGNFFPEVVKEKTIKMTEISFSTKRILQVIEWIWTMNFLKVKALPDKSVTR